MIEEKKPFFSHLKELRDRLVVCVVAVGIAFIITYAFKERIFGFLMHPFVQVMPAGSSFIFTNVTEAFITYFKIAIVAAIFLGSPVLLYEIWMFVAPGLYDTEKNYVYPFIIFGSLLFISGALFCYYVVMPVLFRFFVGYASELVVPMPSLKEYMGLALKMLITFGFIFLLPLVAYYLSRAGIINHRLLSSKRRYAILGIFVLSAIITPPEMTSQLLIVVPLIGLYEVSIIISRIFGKKKASEGDTDTGQAMNSKNEQTSTEKSDAST